MAAKTIKELLSNTLKVGGSHAQAGPKARTVNMKTRFLDLKPMLDKKYFDHPFWKEPLRDTFRQNATSIDVAIEKLKRTNSLGL